MIRYSDFGQTISITLVPVVGTDNRAPRDAALRIARLYIVGAAIEALARTQG